MPSLWFVLRRSKNSTSIGAIRMPPAVPLNHPPGGRRLPTSIATGRHVPLFFALIYGPARLPRALYFFQSKRCGAPRGPPGQRHPGGLPERGARMDGGPSLEERPAEPARAPKSNYELFNCSNVNIRYWSWNYRGCWHQTCPPMAPHTRV